MWVAGQLSLWVAELGCKRPVSLTCGLSVTVTVRLCEASATVGVSHFTVGWFRGQLV